MDKFSFMTSLNLVLMEWYKTVSEFKGSSKVWQTSLSDKPPITNKTLVVVQRKNPKNSNIVVEPHKSLGAYVLGPFPKSMTPK